MPGAPKTLRPVPVKGAMQPCRGEPAGARSLALQVALVAGLAGIGGVGEFTPVMILWLSRLKASPVNWSLMLSWMGTSREMRKSTLLKPGPMMLLRPI